VEKVAGGGGGGVTGKGKSGENSSELEAPSTALCAQLAPQWPSASSEWLDENWLAAWKTTWQDFANR